jgi:hypothetical protein
VAGIIVDHLVGLLDGGVGQIFDIQVHRWFGGDQDARFHFFDILVAESEGGARVFLHEQLGKFTSHGFYGPIAGKLAPHMSAHAVADHE